MIDIKRRLVRLEEAAGHSGSRQITVTSAGASDDEVAAFLAAQGIQVGSTDRVLHFVTIDEDRDGNPSPDSPPLALGPIIHL